MLLGMLALVWIFSLFQIPHFDDIAHQEKGVIRARVEPEVQLVFTIVEE
jgi:hypothetical protein